MFGANRSCSGKHDQQRVEAEWKKREKGKSKGKRGHGDLTGSFCAKP